MSSFVLIGYELKSFLIRTVFDYRARRLFLLILVCLCIWMPMCIVSYKANLVIDIHKLKFGIAPINFISSICGIVCVVFSSILIKRYLHLLMKGLVFLGKNSLLIMLTHEHLMLRQLAINLANLVFDGWLGYLLTFIIILLSEIVLCGVISGPLTSLVGCLTKKLDDVNKKADLFSDL